MVTGKPPLVYLDSCILIASLKNEKRSDPAEMKGVKDLIKHIDEGKLNMITSALTKAEILRCTLSRDAQQKLDDVFKRRNVQVVETTHVIWDKTHDLRDHYKKEQLAGGPKTLSTPDAVHLATAVVYGADKFYTFDGKSSGGKARPLLPLSGNVAGHDLIIERPIGELDLFSQAPVEEEAEDDEEE